MGLHLVTALVRAGLPVIGAGKHPGGPQPPERAGGFRNVGPAPELPGAVCYEGPDGRFWYLPLALEDAAPVPPCWRSWTSRRSTTWRPRVRRRSRSPNPATTFTANLTGTLNLLEAVRALPDSARPIVLSVGSCEEYGPQDHGGRPLAEDTPLNPISPYAVSKAAQTLLCRQYARSWDLPVIPVRSFSHTGAGPRHPLRLPRVSPARSPPPRPAPARPRSAPATCRPVRDFLDVRDVIAAYRLLVQHGQPGEVVQRLFRNGFDDGRGDWRYWSGEPAAGSP